VRAAVIAYFVVFSVLSALPSAGRASAERLERPVEQAELRRWARLFNGLGIATDPERLAAAYLPLAALLERVHGALILPIDWWQQLTDTRQTWRLFSMPHDRPSALKIVVSRGGQDELLYQSSDGEHDWGAGLLEYRRVRAAYKPSQAGPPGTYPGFAARLSERIFAELPEVERVTVSLVRSHTPLPGADADPSVEEFGVSTFARAGP
jgi:hypothetical protein